MVRRPFNPTHGQRQNMTVWSSTDSGAHWALMAGVGSWGDDAAYSALTPYNSTHAALVWERGGGHPSLIWDVVPLHGGGDATNED